jgi:hypothetical protein
MSGDEAFDGRRTVSPTRTTSFVAPPVSDTSSGRRPITVCERTGDKIDDTTEVR